MKFNTFLKRGFLFSFIVSFLMFIIMETFARLANEVCTTDWLYKTWSITAGGLGCIFFGIAIGLFIASYKNRECKKNESEGC